MVKKAIPHPSVLDNCQIIGARNGVKRWKSSDGEKIYTWDSLHGEIEVFNKRGRHLGVADPKTGIFIKGAVSGRKIDV